MRFLPLASCTGVQAYREFMSLNDDLPNWIPVECTLPTDQQPARWMEFDELFRGRIDVEEYKERVLAPANSRSRRIGQL